MDIFEILKKNCSVFIRGRRKSYRVYIVPTVFLCFNIFVMRAITVAVPSLAAYPFLKKDFVTGIAPVSVKG